MYVVSVAKNMCHQIYMKLKSKEPPNKYVKNALLQSKDLHKKILGDVSI